jgi:hypothetical protein
MHRLVVGVTLAVACTAMFAGAASATPAPTGSAILLYTQPQQTFPAGQPFHIEDGWGNVPSEDGGVGLWRFSLTVDGIPQMCFPDTRVSTDFAPPLPLILHPMLCNFPQGMTGTHVFSGIFSGPCAEMVSQGFATGPCSSRTEIVPTDPNPLRTITVTFVPSS